MTFEVLETSRFRGMPLELYFFQYGASADSYYAYTNGEQAITLEGVTYRPEPIRREGIRSNGTMDKSLLSIDMPKTLEIPEMFRVYPPSRVVNMTIRQGHSGLDGIANFPVCWSGRVINATRKGNEATLGCEPVQTSMKRSGLRQHYQYSCPHDLYGPRCKAIKVLYPAAVAEISGTTVTLFDGWNTSPHSAARFVGGLFEWDSTHNREPRTILQLLATNTFLLSGFLRELLVGDPVELALGCPHDLRGCENIHGNVQNYGGCAWIPFESPFGKNPF